MRLTLRSLLALSRSDRQSVISRLNSLDDPIELQENMFFALETYFPAADGRSAARIEEQVICTAEGAKVVTLFPAEELMVANEY